MSKHPNTFEWDEVAFRIDTELLSPQARGIYRDILGHLYLQKDRSGVITGTRDELARAGRCPAAQMDATLDELSRHRVCEIHRRDGIITLVNRRMRRAAGSNGVPASTAHAPPGGPLSLSLRLKKDLAPRLEAKALNGGIVKGGAAAARSMTAPELDIAQLAETVLAAEWPNDSRKWLNRITGCPDRHVPPNPSKVRRVFEEVKNAVAEERIKTTPARYAEQTWKEFA